MKRRRSDVRFSLPTGRAVGAWPTTVPDPKGTCLVLRKVTTDLLLRCVRVQALLTITGAECTWQELPADTDMAQVYRPSIRGRKLSSGEHCGVPSPQDIAFDATLSLDDRLECLLDWRDHLRKASRGEPPPERRAELWHVVEAVLIVTASARSSDDWEHFMRPSISEGQVASSASGHCPAIPSCIALRPDLSWPRLKWPPSLSDRCLHGKACCTAPCFSLSQN